MLILEERDEQTICKDDDGKIITVPNSDYYWTKHIKFQGKAVGWIFSEDCYVRETMDQRIFNCWCGRGRIQLRQDLSDDLCAIIRNYIKGVSTEEDALTKYKELFNQIQKEIPDMDMLRYYLSELSDVKITLKGFEIKNNFLIDYKGNAWVKGALYKYNSLCIVMKRYDKNMKFLMSDGELHSINALTLTIISKIMFLLNPNLEDRVFTRQLSKEILNRLDDNEKEVNV